MYFDGAIGFKMKQNKYDDPEFFARYSAMPRSIEGLAKAGEWDAFRLMLPDLTGKRVLDLGCGFGWHCRYARDAGASTVVGVDLSANMLSRARELTDDAAIEYRQGAIEDVDVVDGEFDVVLSSLALHYVADVDGAPARRLATPMMGSEVPRDGGVFRIVHRALCSGGTIVFSVEHPIFTSRAEQDWCYGANGERVHWPVDGYQSEGERRTNWLADDVVKYHRTVAGYVNGLIDNGFQVTRLVEPSPSETSIAVDPEMADEARRPMFLLVSAVKAT